jgi:hypothetical protein
VHHSANIAGHEISTFVGAGAGEDTARSVAQGVDPLDRETSRTVALVDRP